MGFREERAPGAGPRDARSPCSAVVSTPHPSAPSSEFPDPAGAWEGLGLPASRAVPAPESIRPAPRFVGSSGAAAADRSPRVGHRFRPGQTLPESASIGGSTLLHPSALPPTPRDLGDRFEGLHQASGSRFHQVGENAKTGLNWSPHSGEAAGGGERG